MQKVFGRRVVDATMGWYVQRGQELKILRDRMRKEERLKRKEREGEDEQESEDEWQYGEGLESGDESVDFPFFPGEENTYTTANSAINSCDLREENHSENCGPGELDGKNESALTGSEDEEDEIREIAIGDAEEEQDRHGYQIALAIPNSLSDEADSCDADESEANDSAFNVSYE